MVKYLFTWESDVKRQCWSEAMEGGGGVLHVFLSCTALYKNVLSSVVDILLFCYCGSCLLLCTTLSPIWRSPSCALCFSTKERHVCMLSVSWSLTRCVCAWYMFSLRFSFFLLFVCFCLFLSSSEILFCALMPQKSLSFRCSSSETPHTLCMTYR